MWWLCACSTFSSSSSSELLRRLKIVACRKDRETGRRRPKHCRAKEEEEELLEKTRRNDDDEDGDGVVVMIFLFERQKRAFSFLNVVSRVFWSLLIFYYTHNIQKIKPLFPVDESISINQSINRRPRVWRRSGLTRRYRSRRPSRKRAR